MTYKPKQGQVFQLDIPDSGIAYVKVDKVVNKERWYWFPKKYYVLRYQPINRLSPSFISINDGYVFEYYKHRIIWIAPGKHHYRQE